MDKRKQKMMDYILTHAKGHIPFPDGYLPATVGNLCVGIADDGDHYRELGIKEGTLLFFDCSKAFTRGTPSLFIDTNTGVAKMLRNPQKGFHHAGSLVATLSAFEGM